MITRKTSDGIKYITQIGTGNYNEKTSTLYTDLSLITADERIGNEVSMVFRALMLGETVEETNYLLVAPKCLQNKILMMIEQQIQKGKNGYIGIKINSLTDKVIIDKLIEASKAGVKVELCVRGICCLVPGIPGITENIKVVSIVGRFLEHSRIYIFGTPETDKQTQIFIGSADFMTRNTERRVEVAVPIYDSEIRNRLIHIFTTVMQDDEKGKEFTKEQTYIDRNLHNGSFLSSQELFYEESYGKYREEP